MREQKGCRRSPGARGIICVNFPPFSVRETLSSVRDYLNELLRELLFKQHRQHKQSRPACPYNPLSLFSRTYLSHRSIKKALQDIDQLALRFGRRPRVFHLRADEVADLTALKCVLTLGVSGTTGSFMLRYLRAKLSHQTTTMELMAKGAVDHLRG